MSILSKQSSGVKCQQYKKLIFFKIIITKYRYYFIYKHNTGVSMSPSVKFEISNKIQVDNLKHKIIWY